MKTYDHVALENEWATSERWRGIKRDYTAEDVLKLRGSVEIKYTLAELGAKRLWELLHSESYVPALGAMTGCQAVQQVQAGLKAIYLSGWQVAADANVAGQMYPDQSLYPANSVPDVVRKINHAFQRADQIDHAEGRNGIDWFAPIVADAEAGFGGCLNAFELMKAMIEAGAAGVHFEDQLASCKKCGHMGGKVLVPTQEFIQKLTAARLAADVLGVDTILVARTDADAAGLLTSDVDERDHPFLTGERTTEGFFTVKLAPICEHLDALDYSTVALSAARGRTSHPQVRFREWDMRNDELEGEYDLMVAMGVLTSLYRPSDVRAVAEKLLHVIRPGGHLLFSDVRQSRVFEQAWWGRIMLRGGEQIRRFLQRHSQLETLQLADTDSHVFALFRKRRS